MKKLIIIIAISVCVFANEIVLGVVPQQSPLKLSKKWIQIVNYLNDETGLNVVFKTERSIPLFEKVLYDGGYDIAYMNPYHFVVANKSKNYEAILRANKNIVGIILAKSKTIDLTSENLKDKTFLFPAPNAFAATLLPKFELKKKIGFDIDKEAKVLYVNSHDSVYKGVAREIGDFGGGIIRTYNNFTSSNDKDILHIVYKTDAYPSHPFAVHPRVDKDSIEKLQNAFLKMPESLKKLLSIKEFKITDSKEYDAIKEIGVK